MAVLSAITQAIGSTPLVRLARFGAALDVEIYAKVEGVNPGGSVKDRIVREMVLDAEGAGRLGPGATLVEPTSGNTGIALAMVAAARGYRLIVVMPETMSRERVALLRAYGADVRLTPGSLMRGAVDEAERLGREIPGAVLLRQFENPANPRAHERTTAEEIWRDTEGHFDVFIAGIGTGGTITGVARALKPRIAGLQVVGVEPHGAAVLSGKRPVGHGIQGLGAGFIPGVLDRSLLDRVLAVTEAEALSAARDLARADGILGGFSSGAALAALRRMVEEGTLSGRRVVVVLPDTGERYVSTELFEAVSR
jgi:cysteine synthase